MEHTPFETWIIEEKPRTNEQERALQAHLQECAQCRRLLEGWRAVHAKMGPAAVASPMPGFSARFQNSLAERRARQQLLQVRRALLGFWTATFVLFLGLMARLFLESSPVSWVVKIFATVLRTVSDLNTLQHFASSWMQAMPFSLPLAVWILISTGFVVLVAGWGFTLWRVTTQGVANQ